MKKNIGTGAGTVKFQSCASLLVSRVHMKVLNRACSYCLSSNQRLLFRGGGHLGDLLNNGLLGRGSGKDGNGLLGCGLGSRSRSSRGSGGGRSIAAAEHLLDLFAVITSILLAHGGDLVSLLLSELTDLSGLGVDGIRGVLDVGVDELLVRGVDERNEEGNGGSDDSKTPVRDELDKEVGEESGSASLGDIRVSRGAGCMCK